MATLQSFALSYVVNSLWQMPVIVLAAWIIALLLRRCGTSLEHRIWVAAPLIATLLPACNFDIVALAHRIGIAHHPLHGETIHLTAISVAMLPGAPQHRVFQAALVLYAAITFFFALRLLLGLGNTARMRRQALPAVLSPALETLWQSTLSAFHLQSVIVLESPTIAGPVVIGITSPCLLLPAGWGQSTSEDDLAAAFAHECAHIARHDFAKNLLYAVLTLPIAFHPIRRIMSAQLVQTREMLCDSMAANVVSGPDRYARSLLRLASLLVVRTPGQTLHAIGIFDANDLERRIMNLTQRSIEVKGMRKMASAAVALVLALGTCATALALRINLSLPGNGSPIAVLPGSTEAGDTGDEVQHVGGAIHPPVVIKTANPQYTRQAREAKLSGNVEVYLIVDEKGNPTHVKVAKSLGMGLDENAIKSIQKYKFKPATKDGKPVKVDLYIDVNFQIF